MKKLIILYCLFLVSCGGIENGLKEWGQDILSQPEYMIKHFKLAPYKNNTSLSPLLVNYYLSVFEAVQAKDAGTTYVFQNPTSCDGEICIAGFYVLDAEHLSYFPTAISVDDLLLDLNNEEIALIIAELETGESPEQIQQQVITYIEKHLKECAENYEQCIRDFNSSIGNN